MMINIYEQRLQSFIQHQKAIDVLADRCNWNDVHLRSRFNSGFYFVNTHPLIKTNNSRHIIHPNVSNFKPLKPYYADIAKAYWITLVTRFTSNCKSISVRAIVARQVLSILAQTDKQLCDLSTIDWNKFIEYCSKYSKPVGQALYGLEFIEKLKNEKLIPANVKFNHPFSHAESLEKKLIQNKKKMPSHETVMAIGSIFHEKMPKVGEPFEIITDQRERMALALLALSFAAPNRAAAEYFLLSNQELTSKMCRDVNGETKEQFSLNWIGSKQFKDHRKHIWNQMAPAVERSLYFFKKACDPARVLLRFYECPDRPIQDLIENTGIKLNLNISPTSKVSLWQLGEILGFYENYLEVNQKYLKTIDGFPHNVDENKILNHWQLMALINNVYQTKVNGLVVDNSAIAEMPDEIGRTHSLRSFQTAWIKYVLTKNPDFPVRKHINGKEVTLSSAMIVMLGCQQRPGNYTFSCTSFSISAANLASNYMHTLKHLFTNNGYDAAYSITPHQPRHYINTLCQEEGLGQELIAHFSGRTNVVHNIHYNHASEEEKHFKTATLHGDISRNITVIDATEYTELTGRAAADMGVGLCIQDLYQNPCTFLSDFECNCIGCLASAYCKGNKQAIELMKRDLAIQEQRLKSAPLQLELTKNILSARWFKLHSNKVSVYKALIELMDDESIPNGSIIRFTEQRDQFAVIDLHDKTRVLRTVQLPAPDAALNAKLIEEQAQASDEEEPTKLNQLLESFGL